jgi:hypothetical protein
MANVIVYLSENKKVAKQMGKADYEYVTKHFNRKQQARQFLNVIMRFENGYLS